MKRLQTTAAIVKADQGVDLDAAGLDVLAGTMVRLATAAGWDPRLVIAGLVDALEEIAGDIDLAEDTAQRRARGELP